jgi:uncharacterized protein YgiM (DUF1202 family)
MRLMELVLACLLVLALAVLPAVAASSTAPATPSKTAKKAPAGKTPAAPAATSPAEKVSPAPSSMPEKVLPPLEPPSSAPSTPATPSMPGTPAIPAAPGAEKAPPSALSGPTTTPLPGTTPPAEPPMPATKVFPYTGYISGDTVYVRSGPGAYYYPLLTMSKDTRVTVDGEAGGWLAVKPPPGVVGLMRKGDLTMGQGGAATVSASSTRVYASSPTAKRQWCVMATLKQGDTVKTLGAAEGDWVRIQPPEGSHVYVADQYVAASGTGSSAAESAIAKMEIEPPKVDPFIEEFKKADVDLEKELAKPITDRKFDDVTARFKDIAEKADKAFVKSAAAKRLAYIAGLREQQAEVQRVLAIGQNLDQRLAELKSQRVAKENEAARERKEAIRTDFLATGLVARMESLEDVDYPIKFKLVDQNNRPVVVLKSSTIDLNKYVGKVVGVRGSKTYLKDWRIYLVTVDEIEALE